ncbi:hypothetical protein AK812_SmicGene16301 [Symbiodinium microadriaticum]|uniref:Uncharacterized protein n=1 Tax=Symbiodinium microadriaticum TaxID=2951 RepID=A0A1Q9E0N3_SYMMI|nr:hypothetical protein AK812_SmicGene16301 [Symbiodinium microadriaticum]
MEAALGSAYAGLLCTTHESGRAVAMAASGWLTARLRDLAELGHGDGRAELIAKLYQKISFVDSCFLGKKSLDEIAVDEKSWEEAIDAHRAEAAKQLVPLRPRVFQMLSEAPVQVQMDEAESQSSRSPPSSSKKEHISTEVVYLKSEVVRGVLQLHKVSQALEGYKVLLRAEEIWGVARRSQLFSNYCSKLQDGLSLDIAQAWKVNVEATYVLQTRGLLEISGGFVCLRSWRRFLETSDMMKRWRNHSKVLSKQEHDIETGIRLAAAAWFIFRQPHQEMFKDQVTWGRLQRRLLHTLSQAAEKETLSIAMPDMPPLQPDHNFHPASKMLRWMGDYFVEIANLGPSSPSTDSYLGAAASVQAIWTSSDFMLRYTRRTEEDLTEALKLMKFKSVGLICDASPKAKMDAARLQGSLFRISRFDISHVFCDCPDRQIWLPILVMPETIGLGTLQRLSALLASTASHDEKMKAAALISDSRTMSVLGEMQKKENKKQLKLGPKALNKIKQERLASRQELKAVVNVLSHVGLDMDAFYPKQPLLPRGSNEARHVHQIGSENCCFVYDKYSGDSRWDVPMHAASEDVRLVLCADQGSPLYSCFQYLAFAGLNVWLIRDELHDNAMWVALSGAEITLEYAKPDDLLMQMFQRDILKENDYEETSDETLNFNRVMEILGKVLTSEEMFSLFRVARLVLDPFRELCVELALSSSGLGMIPDIAAGAGADQVLTVKFRRAGDVLREAFGMYLATLHETEQYALYLRSAPHKAAGLVSECSDPGTKDKILAELKDEWQLILELEGSASGAALLRANCLHCTFQCFRETMGAYEKSNWKLEAEANGITAAWFPSFCQSASLESVFGDLSDACKRSLQNRLGTADGAPDQVQGKNPEVAAAGFWASNCFATGMLLKYKDCFYVATGKTPGVLQAARLMELPYVFSGKLPQQATDETRMPCNAPVEEDPLDEGSRTAALTLDVGRHLIHQLCFEYDEVRLYGYTLHICDKSLEAKCGTAVILRRGLQELPLMEYLVFSQQILLCTNASLTELLQQHDIQMPKNSTKPQRLRRILAMDQVRNACGDAKIQKLLSLLEEQEAKKKNKEKENEEQKNEDEVEWEELLEDPATEACKQLLARMEEEEKQDEDKQAEAPKPSDEQLRPPKRHRTIQICLLAILINAVPA